MSDFQNIARADGKVIGFIKDGVFRKRVKGSVHLMKKYDAWGLDLDILKSLPDECQIRVLDEEKRVVYTTTKEIWMEKGIADEVEHHGMQKFMPRKYFETTQPKAL